MFCKLLMYRTLGLSKFSSFILEVQMLVLTDYDYVSNHLAPFEKTVVVLTSSVE